MSDMGELLREPIQAFCEGKTIEEILNSSCALERAMKPHAEIDQDAIYTYKVIAGSGPLGLAVDKGLSPTKLNMQPSPPPSLPFLMFLSTGIDPQYTYQMLTRFYPTRKKLEI